MAAVTNYHKLVGYNNRNVFSYCLESRSLNSVSLDQSQSVDRDMGGSRGEFVLVSSSFLVAANTPWLVALSLHSLPLWSYAFSSVCDLPLPLSYKVTCVCI